MKRRIIKIRSSSSEVSRKVQDIKAMMRERMGDASEAQLEAFIEFAERVGLSNQDLSSAMKQFDNRDGHKQAIEVWTLFNEHAIDQVILQQGAYTQFNDTAANPNYALRHRGQAETIIRRLTLGDTLLLQAANLAQFRDREHPQPADQTPTYWRNVFTALLSDIAPDLNAIELLSYPAKAAATALQFLHDTSGLDELSYGAIISTFLTQGMPFYSGVVGNKERIRLHQDGYEDRWVFTSAEDTDESYFLLATMVVLYGIDNYTRGAVATRNLGSNPKYVFNTYFVNNGASEPYAADAGDRFVRQEPTFDLGDTATENRHAQYMDLYANPESMDYANTTVTIRRVEDTADEDEEDNHANTQTQDNPRPSVSVNRLLP